MTERADLIKNATTAVPDREDATTLQQTSVSGNDSEHPTQSLDTNHYPVISDGESTASPSTEAAPLWPTPSILDPDQRTAREFAADVRRGAQIVSKRKRKDDSNYVSEQDEHRGVKLGKTSVKPRLKGSVGKNKMKHGVDVEAASLHSQARPTRLRRVPKNSIEGQEQENKSLATPISSEGGQRSLRNKKSLHQRQDMPSDSQASPTLTGLPMIVSTSERAAVSQTPISASSPTPPRHSSPLGTQRAVQADADSSSNGHQPAPLITLNPFTNSPGPVSDMTITTKPFTNVGFSTNPTYPGKSLRGSNFSFTSTDQDPSPHINAPDSPSVSGSEISQSTRKSQRVAKTSGVSQSTSTSSKSKRHRSTTKSSTATASSYTTRRSTIVARYKTIGSNKGKLISHLHPKGSLDTPFQSLPRSRRSGQSKPRTPNDMSKVDEDIRKENRRESMKLRQAQLEQEMRRLQSLGHKMARCWGLVLRVEGDDEDEEEAEEYELGTEEDV